MTTSTITRYLSAIALGATLTALTSRADPVSTDQFSLSPSVLAPLGLPDRDVVRNPYSTLMGNSYSGLLPQTAGVVGPNLGLGVGFSPSLILGGGGGGGGGGSTLGLTGPSAGGLPGGTGSGSSGVSSSTVVTTVGLSVPVILPPGGGSSNQSNNTISNLVVAQNVPEGGHSAMLLGSGLLLAWAFRRRLGRSS